MRVTGGPDIAFTGHLIAQIVEARCAAAPEDHHEVRLWQSAGGALIAERAIVPADTTHAADRHVMVLSAEGRRDEMPSEQRQRAIMTFFEWSEEAKALARRLGWNVIQHIE